MSTNVGGVSGFINKVSDKVENKLEDLGETAKSIGITDLAETVIDTLEGMGKDPSILDCRRIMADLLGHPLSAHEQAELTAVLEATAVVMEQQTRLSKQDTDRRIEANIDEKKTKEVADLRSKLEAKAS